ncbi:MAG TPA: 8-oxoguanine DNA glycosylase [Clostridiales bacterium UBA8960]|jgi:N-glycosylase/DNA lyase|nr:8-oxoguanine DNA glycosylase [Clostridiales bacterium UBA8960]
MDLIRVIKLDEALFDIRKTLTCGQCFRWAEEGDRFIGVVKNTVLALNEQTYLLEIYGEDLDDAYIHRYFDFNTDYSARLHEISLVDAHLKKAVAYGSGIRLLNQEPFETLISFILSSNNNIPKIKLTIEALSEKFGKPIGVLGGKMRFAFPDVNALGQASLEALNVKAIGYRVKSVFETCAKILHDHADLHYPYDADYLQAKIWLKQFYGVGDKVADCVLLFAYGKQEAFPVDTWVKRVLKELYEVESDCEAFIRAHFLKYPGLTQQVLFYYIRQNKLK